jgi:translation initiation factor 1
MRRAMSDDPFNNPFGKLGGKKPPPAPPKAPARAVVRYERKGHGGKEMTRVEHLGLSPKELERWLKEAKQGLGCGGVVEKDALLLQGDQRERLRAWLEKRGVAKVTVS